MTMTDPATDLAPGNACAAFDADEIAELAAIVAIHEEAGGPVMTIAGWAGGKGDAVVAALPDAWQARVAEATEAALRQAYRLASQSQGDAASDRPFRRALGNATGERWHRLASGLTGALGGAGGIATTLVDLPITTTLILRSIQQIAVEHGEDPGDPLVSAQCIAVFGLGGPLREDDAAETGLWGTRLALGGKAVAAVIATVVPRLGVVVGEKALAQAMPLLGALAGAVLNPVFAGYYQAMAHVHFRLRKLERRHDPETVRACFERIVRTRREAEAAARAQVAGRR